MSSNKVISEQLDEFNKLILDLENIDVQIYNRTSVVVSVCFQKRVII